MNAAARQRLRILAAAAALAVGTGALYLPVLDHDFVEYDDPIYVTENPQLGEDFGPASWWRAFREPYETNWIPLTWISLQLDHALFGMDPAGYHATNAVLHALATALLFVALRRLTGRTAASLFVAAVFAVHPLHVESVAWASERKDTLSGVFFMLCLWAYARWTGTDGTWRSGLVLFACFAAGLLAKPMLVSLPLLLLLLDWWPLGRLDPGESGRRVAARITEKIPLFALAAGAALVTLRVQAATGAMPTEDQLPFALRAMNAATSTWHYVLDSFWPTGLAVFYPHPGRDQSAVVAALAAAALAGVTAVAWSQRRRRPSLFVGWAWFGVTLLPVIGLVQVGMQARADRYTYLPQIGLTIALAYAADAGSAGSPTRRRALAALACAAVAALAVGARAQLRHWRDTTALYERAAAVTDGNFLAHHGLGVQRLEAGDFEAAREQFARAAAIKPRWPAAHQGLGDALLELGETDAARESYERAVALAPRNASAHAHLGRGRMLAGDLDGAIDSYRRAIQLHGDASPAELHAHLASVLARRGRTAQAALQYRAAVRRRPDFAPAHANLGMQLARLGRTDEARRSLERAVELGLGSAEVHAALGSALSSLDEPRAAVRHYREALRLRPGWAQVTNNLAWLLATHPDPGVRDPAAAVALAEGLAAPNAAGSADFLDTLAAAYAAAGRRGDAVSAASAALELAASSGRDELARTLRARLATYEAGGALRLEARPEPVEAGPTGAGASPDTR